jgi:mycothiol maleylpyruvate isomerase-like protein
VPDLAVAFREIRRALMDDLTVASAEQWATAIPTRPQWDVKDTVAMLAGFAEALIVGRWTEDYSDSWADHEILDGLHNTLDRLIQERRGRSGTQLLTEWEANSSRLEHMMNGEEPFPDGTHPFVGWSYLWAVVQNSHNIWAALGIVKARDFSATILCLESAVIWLDMRLQATGRPALRLRAGTTEWVVGDGPPAATVSAPAFELFRALSGRRSLEQIRAFDWEGDSGQFMEVFSPFEPPKEAFVE